MSLQTRESQTEPAVDEFHSTDSADPQNAEELEASGISNSGGHKEC